MLKILNLILAFLSLLFISYAQGRFNYIQSLSCIDNALFYVLKISDSIGDWIFCLIPNFIFLFVIFIAQKNKALSIFIAVINIISLLFSALLAFTWAKKTCHSFALSDGEEFSSIIASQYLLILLLLVFMSLWYAFSSNKK
ncbi:MAG: hypothetical protein V4525_14405 [Pseudomonadota bacterium]